MRAIRMCEQRARKQHQQRILEPGASLVTKSRQKRTRCILSAASQPARSARGVFFRHDRCWAEFLRKRLSRAEDAPMSASLPISDSFVRLPVAADAASEPAKRLTTNPSWQPSPLAQTVLKPILQIRPNSELRTPR
jgi:hypothetical protein